MPVKNVIILCLAIILSLVFYVAGVYITGNLPEQLYEFTNNDYRETFEFSFDPQQLTDSAKNGEIITNQVVTKRCNSEILFRKIALTNMNNQDSVTVFIEIREKLTPVKGKYLSFYKVINKGRSMEFGQNKPYFKVMDADGYEVPYRQYGMRGSNTLLISFDRAQLLACKGPVTIKLTLENRIDYKLKFI